MIEKLTKIMLHGLIVGVFVSVVACNYDYTDTNEDYYANDYGPGRDGTSSLLLNGELYDAIQAGKDIVIIDVDPIEGAAFDGRKFIPNAISIPFNEFEVTRSDGPIVVDREMIDGETMDRHIRNAGINRDTMVVLTGSWTDYSTTPPTPLQESVHAVSSIWWMFHYWGFDRTRLKILDGGNAGYEDYLLSKGEAMADRPRENQVTSQFSVQDIPGNNMYARATLQEVLDGAKNNTFRDRKAYLISTIFSNTITFPVGAPVDPVGILKGKFENGNVFGGRIGGSIQMKNSTYTPTSIMTGVGGRQYFVFDYRLDRNSFIDQDTGLPFLPEDRDTRIITHCYEGFSTAPFNFVIREILGYRNVGLYDGSFDEWGALSAYRATDVSESYIWDVVAQTPTSFLRWNGTNFQKWDNTTATINKDGVISLDNLGWLNPPAGDTGIVRDYETNLQGTIEWDTSRYTDYLYFIVNNGKSATVNDPNAPIASGHATVINPNFRGSASTVNDEDLAYKNGDNLAYEKGVSVQ
ncbi:MAG: hypothetical protein LBV09_07720 [Deferribacteraceae bacterium]|nr:hypothetical protein [Deferribacteraceae bacterium]